MTSLLNVKISAAKAAEGQSEGSMSGAAHQFAPFQELICGSLRLLTGEDCEASGIDISKSSASDFQHAIESPSIKTVFHTLAGENKGLAILSPGLAGYIARSSLHISANEGDPLTLYIPSKLDALLLRPLTNAAGQALGELLGGKTAMLAKSGLSFEDMEFGKPQMKELGELTQITLQFTAPSLLDETKAAPDAATENSKASGTPATPLSITLLIPEKYMRTLVTDKGSSHENERPVLDPSHPWTAHMRNSLKMADVPIRAVVESCHMTIAECTRLEIGQVISLPGVSLGAVGLFINEDMDSDSSEPPIELARGALGIFKKNRALKLTEDIDSSFTQDWDWVTI